MIAHRPKLYRASTQALDARIRPQETWRMPGNVPYLVDNLWEWTRPKAGDYPSRRTSAFASPTTEEARASQSGSEASVQVYCVTLPNGWKVAQLSGYADARHHPDVRQLVKTVKDALQPTWFSLSLPDKGEMANLFCPGLHAQEVESIVSDSKPLSTLGLRGRVGFWGDIRLIDPARELLASSGEIFFTVPPEGYGIELNE
jgi:hypothetical protein